MFAHEARSGITAKCLARVWRRHSGSAGELASASSRSITMKASAIERDLVIRRGGGDDDEGGQSWRKP